jgi:NADPH:quinone reductase
VKNYSIVGLHWGPYNRCAPEAARTCHRELATLAGSGAIRPLGSGGPALPDVAAGVQRLADGETVGWVVYVA